jgi:hypothetical protein
MNSKTWIGLALVALSSSLSSSFAAPLEGTYLGKIGSLEVVFQLSNKNENAQFKNSYYYRKYSRDIELGDPTGSDAVNENYFAEIGPLPERAEIATLTINLDTLKGNYKNKETGKTLPLELTRLKSNDLKSPITGAFMDKLKKESPFDYLRFNQPLVFGIWLQATPDAKTQSLMQKTFSLGKYKYSYISDTKAQLSTPQLQGSMFKAVNTTLQDMLLDNVKNALGCSDWTMDLKPVYISEKWVSVNGFTSNFCGGAHPNSYPDGLTARVVDGKKVTLEDLYRFIPVPKNLDWNNYDSYSAYTQARGKIIIKLLEQNIPKFKKWECFDQSLSDSFDIPYWSLSPQGLVLQGDFPHVAGVCMEDKWVLPYATIAKYRYAKDAP